jgi:hypothetical protein
MTAKAIFTATAILALLAALASNRTGIWKNNFTFQVSHYREVLRLDRNETRASNEAHRVLGLLFALHGDYTQAVSELERL